MASFYKQLTDEELEQEIRRLTENRDSRGEAYDFEVEGQTLINKYCEELDLRKKLPH